VAALGHCRDDAARAELPCNLLVKQDDLGIWQAPLRAALLHLHDVLRSDYEGVTSHGGGPHARKPRSPDPHHSRNYVHHDAPVLLSDINFAVQHGVSFRIAFLRGSVAEPLAWPAVQLARNPIAVVLREAGHALTLGQVLSNQAVGVFVGPALPSVMRCGEVEAAVARGELLRCLAGAFNHPPSGHEEALSRWRRLTLQLWARIALRELPEMPSCGIATHCYGA